MKKILKKIITSAAIMSLAFGVLAGCQSNDSNSSNGSNKSNNNSSSSEEEQVIRVADFATAIWNDEFIVAYQKGIFDDVFKDDNVTIEISQFANGPAANEAFIAGEIDIVNGIGDQPIVVGMSNGVKTTVLSGAAKQAKNIGIITPKDSGIKEAKDLKDKRIGVFIGTYVHKSLIGILNDAGIKEDDVEIVNITSTSDADAAFESGDIDAYLSMSAYHIYEKTQSGNFVQIADCSKHPAFSYMVASDDFIKSNPELLDKFFEGLYEAEQWINENQEEAYKLISEYSGQDTEQIQHTIEDADSTIVWDEQYEDNLKETYDFLVEHDMITSELTEADIKEHINTTFADKATEQ